MKHLLAMIVVILVCIAGMNVDVSAQTVVNPNVITPVYYTYPGSATVYYRSKTDTIFTSGVKVGGATYVSLVIVNTDSMRTYFYVDWKARGSSQWNSAVYTDSVVTSVPDTTEIQLRSSTVSRMGGIDRVFRIRAAHQSTIGYDSSQTYTPIWIYKP
jgi:hypothetical protein